MPSARPLNTPSKQGSFDREVAQTPDATLKAGISSDSGAEVISSPHELTAVVESMLESLDQKFDEMSSQILERMTQISSRVDTLESSLQDIINSGTAVP